MAERMKSAVSPAAADLLPATDVADLAGVYRAHASYVAGVALRLLGNDAEVDDVVQDVFIAAQSGLATIREPRAIRGWLATIAVRVAMRKLRWRRLRRFVTFGESAAQTELAPGLPADERVLLGRVYAALDTMPAATRVAWSLRYIEGEALEDVAQLCECSLATAKRRIADAQARIKTVVGDG